MADAHFRTPEGLLDLSQFDFWLDLRESVCVWAVCVCVSPLMHSLACCSKDQSMHQTASSSCFSNRPLREEAVTGRHCQAGRFKG